MKTLRNKIGSCACHALLCVVVRLLLQAIPINAQTVSTLAGRGFFADGMGAAAQFRSPTSVAVDGVGNVYVADQDNHRIRKVTSSGVVSTIAGNGYSGYADGMGSAAQFYSPTGIAVDSEGNVYVADQGNHRIRKITPLGIVSTLAGSGKPSYSDGVGIAAQFNAPFGVAVDGGGNLFVTDQNNQRIRKISPLGVVSTLAGNGGTGYADGAGATARFANPSGIAVDWSGNVYIADQLNSRIRKINSSGMVSTFAGNGNRGYTDGMGGVAQFSLPSGVVVDWTDNVYIADQGNHLIRKIAPTGMVSTLAGSKNIPSYADGIGTTAGFSYPTGIAVDGSGSMYVADLGNNCIRKTTSNGFVSTLAGGGKLSYADGVGAVVQFNQPEGISADNLGNVYVVESENKRIRKITPFGTVSTFAGSDQSGYADGVGTMAQFTYPLGTAVDNVGNVYVTDLTRIRKITSAGIVSTFAGNGTSGYTDGAVGTAQFGLLIGITVDGTGNVFVVDNSRIRKITPSGEVSTLAGTRDFGYADGIGLSAQFDSPHGITVDDAGSIYIADVNNQRIRKISPSGIVSSMAGNGGGGYAEGTGAKAQFYLPFSVAADGAGNVYVADSFNHRIRKINSSGVVSTFAGNGSAGYADGAAAAAQFYSPRWVALDKAGNLYVVDNGNNRIRKITPAAPVSVKFTSSNIMSALSIAIAPHPVQDEANLRFTLSATSRVDVLLFDVLGRLVREEVLGVLPEGTHEWLLGMNAFPYGTYTVIVRAGTEQRTKLLQHIR